MLYGEQMDAVRGSIGLGPQIIFTGCHIQGNEKVPVAINILEFDLICDFAQTFALQNHSLFAVG